MLHRSADVATTQPLRVVAVASHPIQYQAPLFRALAQSGDIDFSVLFITMPDAAQQGRGFGIAFTWDIPLLEGYRWRQVDDIRGRGGLDGFFAARISRPRALLRELRPDVLMLTGWHIWPLVQLLFAARSLGIPVVMRGESNNLRTRPWHARLLHRLLLGRCSAFLPIGRASRGFYRSYGIAERQLFDTPYFIDNQRFAQTADKLRPERAALRAKWGIAEAATCFLYAGKLEPKKRILDVLEALREARGRTSAPLHLLVVGTGELMEQAKAAVAQHELPVTFAGFLNQTEIPASYVACDCLVLASDFGETWGLVVNEAMACGKPAIVSDRVGCGPDLVTPGVTGDIFAFADTQALAQCMVRAAQDPARLKAMGQAACDRVTRDYCVDVSASGTIRAVQFAHPSA
ncbi:glycosyltransferase [Caenimonas koreensis DSM 17982]|uniref:Glycosyltransferase n=1 Tax=Caenimonas koreensis DSM 17982 TaxID=1121255 RepID=A0A844AS09_9BURK|nr:glycosyltransferase family 4 protein [Caenimonas koreensis]MRD46844.1 glycosyltransferase [Caenimonas koreensis DSM 17982]